MKIQIKNTLIVNASYYIFINILVGLIPFLLLPILTRYLSPQEFGLVALYTSLVALFSAIFTIGVNGVISRMYFDFNEKEFNEFIGACFSIVVISSFIISVTIFLYSDQLGVVIKFPINWLWTIVLAAFSQALFSIGIAVLQVKMAARQFAIAQLMQSIQFAALTLLLVVFFENGWEGRIFAQVISGALGALAMVAYLFRIHGVSIRYKLLHFKQALRQGLPLFVHIIFGLILSQADRFIISHYEDQNEVGIYVLASQLVMILTFIMDGCNKAYAPWLFNKLLTANYALRCKIVKYTYISYVFFWTASILFASLFQNRMGVIFGKDYQISGQYIFLLSFATAFMWMYFMVTLYIQFSKRTEYLAIITLFVGTSNLFLCQIFVENWGTIGAAYVAVVSQAAMFLLAWIFANYLVPMPWFSFWSQPASRNDNF
jgi:O-antigen/teichoic acid export membrane protein